MSCERTDRRLAPELGHFDAPAQPRFQRHDEPRRRQRVDAEVEQRRVGVQLRRLDLELLSCP
jgi:hypothetical protein